MFPQVKPTTEKPVSEDVDEDILNQSKYKSVIHPIAIADANSKIVGQETQYQLMDELLEREKNHMKTLPWNKLDKTTRTQKLHAFAEKFGKDFALPSKSVKALKIFFSESLEKDKLQKAKEVVYDKERGTIQSIPVLHMNPDTRAFTLRNLDGTRPSTLKSLTPKRITPSKIETI